MNFIILLTVAGVWARDEVLEAGAASNKGE